MAKRLYRFLDKMFWRDPSTFVFDLKELAFRHVGISIERENYDIIRELKKGIAELEAKWPELIPLEAEKRFRRVTHGKWEVEFSPRMPGKGRRQRKARAKDGELFDKLCSRGVNVEGAKKLLRTEPAEKIKKQIEAFDFRMRNPMEGGAIKSPGGFLAAAIREEYELPAGFVSKDKLRARQESMKAGDLQLTRRRQELDAMHDAKDSEAEMAVDEFLSSLPSDEERAAFELASVNASPFLKHYEEAKEDGGPRFERWRRLILRQAVRRKNMERCPSGPELKQQ